MADGPQEKALHTISMKIPVQRLCHLIKDNSLDEVKDMLEKFPPDQCTRILNSTIDNCVPLSVALKYKKIKISAYLLQLSSRQEQQERFGGWSRGIHPLIYAMKTNCFRIVYRISRRIRDINDYISGPYPPLFHAVESSNIIYTRLLLLLGGDVNKISLNGISPLMASVFNQNICRYLLSQKANGNHQDGEGNTALHLAAARKLSESAKILVEAGVDVRIRNKYGLMPLMLASISLNHQTVMDLCELNEYSQIEKIEALEVLNACSVGFHCSDKSYWFRALGMRNPNFPKITDVPAQEIFDFSREFTTKKELKSLQADLLKLAFQGIIIIERILGRNNKTYLRLLLQTTLIAKAENKLEKVEQLIDYIVEFCQKTSAHIICCCSYYFHILFTGLSSNDNPGNIFENGAFDLFKIIARATANMWRLLKDPFYRIPYIEHIPYSELAETFLVIASKIRAMNFPEQYEEQFREVVELVVKKDPRFIQNLSLLHRTVRSIQTETWATVELIRLLLESGADVDAKDSFRRTPLMFAISYVPDDRIKEIIELFIEYNSHIDYRDAEGFSVADLPRWKTLTFVPRSPSC